MPSQSGFGLRPRRAYLPLLVLLYAASGCAALIYEVVWTQLLQLVIGASAVSTGLVLAMFMGGLCLGSLAFPRLVSPTHHPLRVYAVLELCIGALGLLILAGIPVAGGVYASSVGRGLPGLLLRAITSGLCLLPPTVLMGATFPAAARWVGATPTRVHSLGWLYCGNVAGAALGAVLAGFVLLRVYDTAMATYVAVALNFGIGAASLTLAARSREWRPEPHRPRHDAPGATAGTWPILVAIALSGACALGAEVVWTRQLTLMLGATVYTFSIVLTVFLLGLGVGGGTGSWIARRSPHAQVTLGGCQLLLTLAIAWTALALGGAIPAWPADPGVYATPWATFELAMLRSLWAMFPATFLWGASFSLALAASVRREVDTERLAATVYAANSAGAIVGAVACIVATPLLGTQNLQRLLIIISALAAAQVLLTAPRGLVRAHRSSVFVSVGLAGMLLWTVPAASPALISYGRLLAQEPSDAPDYLYVGEGINASVAVSELPSGVRRFHVSGKVEASTGLPDMRLQRMLGNIPALVHPKPESVLVVGFGAGVTAGSFVPYPEMRRLVICEIEPLITRKVAGYFSDVNHGVIDDPRTTVIEDDARHYLLTSQETFDVITSDPIHPWVKGSAALYTKDYFDLVRRHLNPGGVVAQWVPLYESDPDVVKSEIATFFASFPNGTIWANNDRGEGYDLVLLGQSREASIDVDNLQQRLASASYRRVAQSLRDVEFASAMDLLSTYAGQASDLGPWLQGAELNRDRNLRLQYLAGLTVESNENASIYEAMARYRRFPQGLFVGREPSLRALRKSITAPLTCWLSRDDQRWVQDSFDGWEQISQKFLPPHTGSAPWTIVFDDTCVWYIAAPIGVVTPGVAIDGPLSFGSHALPIRAIHHDGEIALPNGQTIPARGGAMSSLSGPGTAPFVAMALPGMWRDAAGGAGTASSELLQTRMIAELAKSDWLEQAAGRLDELSTRYDLPRSLGEDTIRANVQSLSGFREALDAERDVLFQAVSARDVAVRRELIARGLALVRARRATYLSGDGDPGAAIEDIYLALEGRGQWASYQFVQARAPSATNSDVLTFVRNQRDFWLREEGLALFLLLDDFVPRWQARVFGKAPEAPFALLEEALREAPPVRGR